MKNTFGDSVAITLFGESHGSHIGAVVDGLMPGVKIDEDFIKEKLAERRPSGEETTARVECDDFKIISGVFDGKTTGTPLCIIIENADVDSSLYEKNRGLARPGHADYSAYEKFHGFEDYRGGGHFSGRITAAYVAAGAVALTVLREKGIEVKASILDESTVLENAKAAKADGDSVGGVIETVITGIPAGVGEPWFDSVESVLSHALFSIPGIKGVEFGAGFSCADMLGSEFNDELYMDGDKIKTKTNNSGGVNGGITNGMPVVFRCAMRPASSIAKEQNTVNFIEGIDAKISTGGRHDAAIVLRACPVIEAASALAVLDLLSARYGTDLIGL